MIQFYISVIDFTDRTPYNTSTVTGGRPRPKGLYKQTFLYVKEADYYSEDASPASIQIKSHTRSECKALDQETSN